MRFKTFALAAAFIGFSMVSARADDTCGHGLKFIPELKACAAMLDGANTATLGDLPRYTRDDPKCDGKPEGYKYPTVVDIDNGGKLTVNHTCHVGRSRMPVDAQRKPAPTPTPTPEVKSRDGEET